MQTNRVHKTYLCKICSKASGVKSCKCQKVFYCSRNCQKIDWNTHKTDCCFKLVDYPKQPQESHAIGCLDQNIINVGTNNNNEEVFLQNSNCSDIYHVKHPPTHDDSNTLERQGRKYDPTPLQYQQPHATTYTCTATTTTITPLPPNTSSNTAVVDDFDENLFNSLMYSVVDESTEQEILKNLNIRAEDLLATYPLDNDITSSFVSENLKEYVPICEEQSFSEKIFEPTSSETQQMLRETKANLEKELLLLRENQAYETKLNSSTIDKMQFDIPNQKQVSHAAATDFLFTR